MELEELKHEIINLQKKLENKKEVERKLIEDKYSKKLFSMTEEKTLTEWECKSFVIALAQEIHNLELV